MTESFDIDGFKKLLDKECDYRMKEHTMTAFIELMSEVKLRNKEPVISYGQFNDNVYVVREGLVRMIYFDGLMEKTRAFASPGTMFISYYSFYNHQGSLFQFESCGSSVVMKIRKRDFDELLRSSHDFLYWMYRMQTCQLWFFEMKHDVINGTAEERYEALVKNRPEILEKVSEKVIASYIGINPSSLCRLKRGNSYKNRKK